MPRFPIAYVTWAAPGSASGKHQRQADVYFPVVGNRSSVSSPTSESMNYQHAPIWQARALLGHCRCSRAVCAEVRNEILANPTSDFWIDRNVDPSRYRFFPGLQRHAAAQPGK